MSDSAKWLLIRVTDLQTGKSKANIKIPASLANFGLRMAAKYAPESVEGLDMNEIMAAVKNGGDGKLVDVDVVDKGEHVEIFVE